MAKRLLKYLNLKAPQEHLVMVVDYFEPEYGDSGV